MNIEDDECVCSVTVKVAVAIGARRSRVIASVA